MNTNQAQQKRPVFLVFEKEHGNSINILKYLLIWPGSDQCLGLLGSIKVDSLFKFLISKGEPLEV